MKLKRLLIPILFVALTIAGLGIAHAVSLPVEYYGVSWDESNSSPTCTRTGSLKGVAAASKPDDSILPIQVAMRRCILDDSGNVEYYLDPTDSTKKLYGGSSVLTGADGQVMVEIPKFYYRYSYSSNVHTWEISWKPLSGFYIHPAFVKDGAVVDYRYVGAYEGVGYDNSTTAYFDGDDAGDAPATNWPGGTAIDTGNDKLGSVSGYAPLVNETRAEFRSLASNRGTGWRLLDYDLVHAIQLLYLTEYASFNSQSCIGEGRTQLSDGTWAKGSYIKETGNSNSVGNATGNSEYSGDADDAGAEAAYMSYRGIENWYGNIWSWVDGININGNIPYVCNNEANYADDTTTNYVRLEDIGGSGITLHNADGWQTTLEQISRGFLPSAVAGSSSTYITDYYYQNSGWRVARLGGYAAGGAKAGVFCWSLSNGSSDDSATIGGRLCY